MMKLLGSLLLVSAVALPGMAKSADMINIVTAKDPMGIAGTYECKGNDFHDGEFAARFMLVRDENASDEKSDFGAYRSVPASGEAKNQMHRYMEYMLVQGDHAAMYFEHKDNHKDQGIKLLTVTKAKAENGEMMSSLSGPYYEPVYHRNVKTRSGYGTVTCTQVKA